MIYDPSNYVLINESVAKMIPVGTTIIVNDVHRDINHILHQAIKYRFVDYDESHDLFIKISGYSPTDNTRFKYGCVHKSLLLDDDLLIL